MQKNMILAATALVLALGAVTPVIAQQAAPAPEAAQAGDAPQPRSGEPRGPKGPHGMRGGPQSAEIRLNFGGGRMVGIDCGDAKIDACIAAAMPLIDKVASTEPVPFAPHGMMGRDGQHHGMEAKRKP